MASCRNCEHWYPYSYNLIIMGKPECAQRIISMSNPQACGHVATMRSEMDTLIMLIRTEKE